MLFDHVARLCRPDPRDDQTANALWQATARRPGPSRHGGRDPSRGILTWVSIADELPHKGKGTWRKCMRPISKTSTTDLPFPLTFLTPISSDDATLGRGHPDPAQGGDP